MPIVANAVSDGLGNDKFLQHPKLGHAEYANYIKERYNVGAIDGDSDHFVNIVNKVEHLAGIYAGDPTPMTIEQSVVPALCSKSGGAVRTWFSALLCSIMYGCDNGNNTDIHIAGVRFKNNAVPATTLPNLQYLEIWKNKFDNTAGAGNSNDGTVLALGGAGVLETGCDADSFNYITMDPLNQRLAVGYHNYVGTFHDQLFVIPLKEYELDGVVGAIPEWKRKFLYLCGNKSNCTEFLERLNGLNIKQKIFLHLSAASIQKVSTAPQPLKMAAALIKQAIPLPPEVEVEDVVVPEYKTICGISFYKTDDSLDLDGMISDTLYLGRDIDKKYRATYPLTAMSISALNSGSSIKDYRLAVETDFDDESVVLSAKVSFVLNTNLTFIAPATAVGATSGSFAFNYNMEKKYDAEHLKWIRMLPTICMYPNLSTDLEDRCKKFTYVSRQGANILLGKVQGIGAAINLDDGLFIGALDDSKNNVKLIDFAPSAAAPYKNTKAYGNLVVSSTEAEKPEHFIQVTNNLANRNMGYVLNIRSVADGDLPALLEDRATGVDITLEKSRPQLPNGSPARELSAFIDFGSSSSYVRYSIAGAKYNNSLISNKCTLRKCLTEYAQPGEYNSIINDPEKNSHHKFLSNVSIYNSGMPTTDFLPYREAWMPIVRSFKNYPGIGNVSTSHKTDLSVAGNSATVPTVILNNICYIIACNAVNANCSKVIIVPSLPSEDYLSTLALKWDAVISNIRSVFPELEFENSLNKDNTHLLYESVAVSLGNASPATNELSINVDIGDGTTDMSAIYFDKLGAINFCGYSSVEYAGKNLIKTVIKDILVNGNTAAEKIFKGTLDVNTNAYGPSAFVPNSGDEAVYKNYIDNIISDWRDTQDNDRFESRVMDILEFSKLNKGAGANDQKIAANFILRYMFLMPVIKDFIHTAIKIASKLPGDSSYDPALANINIYFKGGASKGIDTFNIVDSRSTGARSLLDEYFRKEFQPKYALSAVVSVSDSDDKLTLIDGLSKLNTATDPIVLRQLGAGNPVSVNPVDWHDVVDPKYTGIFGKENNVHKNALKTPFVCDILPNGSVNTLQNQTKNNAIIKSGNSYYETITNPFEDLKKFYNEEIYGKLIDNHDGVPDVIETLTINFLNDATPSMISAINRELGAAANNSFVKATNSSIYPEMMKSTIFMFTLSEILTKYHRTYRPDHTIKTLNDTPNYQFGG